MKKMMIATALTLFALAGCRQKDVRDFAVDVPALSQENEAAVSGASVRLKISRMALSVS